MVCLHSNRHLTKAEVYWQIWSGGLSGKCSGDKALLEEVRHWRWALRVYRLLPPPARSLCFLPVGGETSSHLPALAACCSASSVITALLFLLPSLLLPLSLSPFLPHSFPPSLSPSFYPNPLTIGQTFFHKLPWSQYFITASESNQHTWWHDFDPQNLHDGRRELISTSRPPISTQELYYTHPSLHIRDKLM